MSNRPTCGTRWGAAEHARAHEDLCGTCLNADDAAKLAHEYRQPVPGARMTGDTATAQQRADLHRVIALLSDLLTEHDNRRRAA